MAKGELHPFLDHLRGRVGEFVFKRYGKKLVVTRRPRFKKRRLDAAEKKKRSLFAKANAYALRVLADPDLRAVYADSAKRTRRRIQNIAISDYLTQPSIDEIFQMPRESGTNQAVLFRMKNADRIVAMHVTLSASGEAVQQGEAELDGKQWRFEFAKPIPTGRRLKVETTAADRVGRLIKKTTTLTVR